MARRGHRTRNLLLFAAIVSEIVSAIVMTVIFGSDAFNFTMFFTSIVVGLFVAWVIGIIAESVE